MRNLKQPSHPHETWWDRTCLAELLVVFLIGVAVMRFMFSATGLGTDVRANLAGNDCFYHVKMAALFPEVPVADTFPWLTQTIFSERFVNHHYGFQAFLSPFVRISHEMCGDYLPGARTAICLLFGLVLVLATLILMSERIPLRWLWLILLLALPADFFVRHAYVRPISLSLCCLLLGCFFMLRGRYILLALTAALYTHLYLGSFFLVILALIHFVSGLCAPRRPVFDLRLLVWIALGFVAGFVTHPHFPENLDFLRTQIFGTGLTPEIPVGQEWNPFNDSWGLACRIGVPLSALALALALRLRLGRRMTRNQWTVLLISFFFFVLLLKARRFIEYWPMFAVLAAALAAGPLFGKASRATGAGRLRRFPSGLMPGLALICLTAAIIVGWRFRAHYLALAYWAPAWLGLGLLYLAVNAWRRRRLGSNGYRTSTRGRAPSTLVAMTALWFMAVGPVYCTVRNWARGKWDLDAVEAAMTAVKAASEPKDIIFTDDWDDFTVFFYFNDYNYYIEGLDPVFAYRHDPELRTRYVKITRGQVPCTTNAPVRVGNTLVEQPIDVELADIRDRFRARFVIVDRDHQPFGYLLDSAPQLARRIFPPADVESKGIPPYRVYEILDAP